MEMVSGSALPRILSHVVRRADGALVAYARAKVNLSLEVIGERPDGYHELVSVMQEVDLADVLEVRASRQIHFVCSDHALNGEDNLVLRVARLLRSRYGISRGCAIRLVKHIPIAAGLGGGSSDAAAALELLNVLWDLQLSRDELLRIGAEIGSDVPFCLYGGTALVEGRGERLSPLPDAPARWLVLTNPGLAVSTAQIFSALSPADWTNGSRTRQMAEAIKGGAWPGLGINGLQRTLFDLQPGARICYERAAELAPNRTLVTGSGATVISWFEDRETAERTKETLLALGYWSRVVVTARRDRGV